jgi:zinc transporter 1/2/3
VATFAFISPIGSGIGIALAESITSEDSLQNNLVTVLQGLATGTLLYVVFFEIIEKERQKKTNGMLQVSDLNKSLIIRSSQSRFR